ncbi:disease resistance protein RPM1-like [Cornus florida]|uniref:disease resistance protein RPM1-like n=1 Tax=Cornus florida TaxID=4283 RepID=UPI00289646D7|nr:disease resistance protein RPM1-like [Cornus florida]
MAEIVLNLVIDNLVPLLKEEVNLLKGVHKEFESIKVELELMKPYLKDADERLERGESNDGVKALVKQVRKVSYRIEDVVDEYILQVLTQRSDQRREFIGCLYKAARSIIKCRPRHKIASEIQEIKATIREIHQLRDRYNLQVKEEGSSSKTWHDPRVSFPFLDDDEVVGIESQRAQLKSWMEEDVSSKRRAISVVGEGGLGKTTLVKKVYDDQIAAKEFACHAWITVSQSPPNRKELLMTLMTKFYKTNEESPPSDLETTDESSLIEKLREYLQDKRCVIVFDDVRKIQFCYFIRSVLPNNNKKGKGSRVNITARNNDVATSTKESSFDMIYKLKRLPDDKAWQLFCKSAFQSDCPRELEKVCHEIVKKCNGVPLAIVTIGRLLSNKDKMVSEFQRLHDRLGSELKSNPHLEDVKKIILLSYVDLPYHLRACFLYFGIFPEDYPIRCGRLVRLWIAEGFVKEESGKTLEEIAEEYLKELIHRSLVQMVVQDPLDYKVRKKVGPCKVHDIMREIILSKYEDLVLLANDDSISDDGQFRCLSIHNKTNDNVMINRITKSRIRSGITFMRDELPESFMGTLMANFKLLKVLPKSIGKLRYLLTLDLKQSRVVVLPIEINKLHKLRHLLASNRSPDVIRSESGAVKIQAEGFGCLKDLQVLKSVEANDDGGSLVKELIKLRQLRKLGMKNLKREDGKDLCIAVENMSHLQSLSVEATLFGILDVQQISSPPDSLQRLFLIGHLEKSPDWISKHQNLISIRLVYPRLTEDPLKFLQTLPSLLKLELVRAYDGKFLHFEGGFQKLERLYLSLMPELISVKADTGAPPLLKFANILECPRLEEVAEKIGNIFIF